MLWVTTQSVKNDLLYSMVTGARRQSLQGILVDLLIITALWFQFGDLNTFSNHVVIYPGKKINSNLIGLIFGIWTVWFAFRTQFRDPGILSPHGNYSSIRTQLLFQYSFENDKEEDIDPNFYKPKVNNNNNSLFVFLRI